jgi:branched-chain amino acid transport system permease protein
VQTALQILLNSTVAGLILSLVAIGFVYIFRVTKVFHLAHGGVYATGGFSCLWLFVKTGDWFLAALFAMTMVSLLISVVEKTVYLPLNNKQSNQSISLIASMGVYVVIVNIIALIFGNENKFFENPISGAYPFAGLIFTKIQIVQSAVCLTTLTLLYIYLKYSKSDLVLQSISDNDTIAKVFGINTEKERVKVLILGSVLAAIAAVLKTLEIGIDPQTGMSITLTASVVAILVARLDMRLIIAFSISLTLLQNTIEWFLSAQWRDGITFLLLLLVILFRTEGIISYNLRKDQA